MPRVQIETLADFTGGLNLRADAFQLAANESPDLMNVDVDPRGGFRLRGGVRPWGDLFDADITALMPFKTTNGGAEVIVQIADGTLWSSTGGTATQLGSVVREGIARSTVFKDRMYVVSGGEDDVVRYDGSSTDELTEPVYNDNLETPTTVGDGHMPRGNTIATHMGSVWIGGCTEGGTLFPNRVRWSHPNFPEDWRALDFIDIDVGHDGDSITALVPWGDRLLVFKQRSIHAIYGEPPTNLQVFPVTVEIGAPSQEAVQSTDVGVYFYSIPEGVFLYQGKDPKWQFERIFPATLTGGITAANAQGIQMGWGNRRLWLSVPWQSGAARDRVFVLDPLLGREGAWVAYDLSVGPFLEWSPPGGAATFIAGAVGRSVVVELDVATQPYDFYGEIVEPFLVDENGDFLVDEFGDFLIGDETEERYHIESWLRTRWVDLGVPAVKKRWRRPQVVMLAGSDAVVEVESFQEYDPTRIRRRFNLRTTADGDHAIWGQFTWGNSRWARAGDGRNLVVRGSSLGSGKAIALKFKGPQTNEAWGVDAVTFTYIPRKVR